MEDIIYPLHMGLGSIIDRGSSLLEAIKQVDQGGVLATPSRAVCLASGNTKLIQHVEESKSRDRRAFCVIMNYTDSKSSNYKFFMTEFNSSGIDLNEFIVANYVLAYPQDQITAKEAYFNNMTMTKCSVPYTEDGWYIWLGKLVDAGKIIGKGADAIAMRFADGLPEFAGTLANDIRKIVNAKSLLLPRCRVGALILLYVFLSNTKH